MLATLGSMHLLSSSAGTASPGMPTARYSMSHANTWCDLCTHAEAVSQCTHGELHLPFVHGGSESSQAVTNMLTSY